MIFNGETLKRARKNAGLTQQQIAQRVGVSRQTVNKIENNQVDAVRALKLITVQRWHSACRVLMTREERQTFADSLRNFFHISID